MADSSGFPAWLSYDSATQMWSITTASVPGVYEIKLSASADTDVTSDYDTFYLTIVAYNEAPVMPTLVDQTCGGFEICQYTIAITDPEGTDGANDSHTLTRVV
jgi:hypothetical protein